jgi:hypothetical protein
MQTRPSRRVLLFRVSVSRPRANGAVRAADSARSVSVLHRFKGCKPGRRRSGKTKLPDEADPHGMRDKPDHKLETLAADPSSGSFGPARAELARQRADLAELGLSQVSGVERCR